MKKCALFVSVVTATFLTFGVKADEPFAAVKAIVGRLAGGYNGAAEAGADIAKANAAMDLFEFVEDDSIAAGAATVGPHEGKIRIAASDAAGASYGLGQYVKYTQKGHISWCANRIPDTWPVPTEETTYTPAVSVRLAYNYCTLSYTMAFWSADQWREEIDRLALEGLNVALVLNGLPAVWRETLRSVKDASGNQVFSDEQIRAFIADEAAMAWWHMGNLEGLGGPMSDARIDADAQLAKWMYAEMMKLGVQPMLQSFVGLMPYIAYNPGLLANGVPKDPAVKAQYPTYGSDPALAWKYLGLWVSAFPRPPILMPTTAAFDDLSDAWYAALANVYDSATAGSTKFLCGDLFHECASSGLSKDVLKAAGKKVQDTQKKYFGEDVTWLLQAWQINESQRFVIQGLDKEHILVEVLDKNMGNNGGLGSDVRDGDGNIAPFIWTEVANFGGNTGMRGFDTRVRKLNCVNESQRSVFSGYGFLSEGFETNPLMYDMMLEQMAKTPNDASTYLDTDAKMASYLEAYRLRRYGYTDSDLRSAYESMLATVWHQKATSAQEGCVENILCALPSTSLRGASVSSWGPKTGTEYDPALLYPAADRFLAVVATKPELLDLPTFRHDFIDLFLQLLGDRARQINEDCATSQKARDQFRKFLDLAERLTACQDRWRLDWHENRTTAVAGAAGKMAYRRMITNWTGNYQTSRTSGLREYAHRAYSGLIKGYYAKRWEWFFQQLEGKLTSAQYEANLKALDAEIQTATIDYTPEGDLLAIANEILETLNPPALTRSITTSSATWNKQDAVWTNAKGQTVAWEDGLDVNLAGIATVTATEPVTTGSLTLLPSDVADPAIHTGWLPVGEANAVKLFENIDSPDFAGFTATMDGAWVPNTQVKAYRVAYDPVTDSTSAQFQTVDGGFLKAVEVKFFRKSDKSIWGYTVGKGNISNGMLGQKVTVNTSDCAQSPTDTGYGVYGIKTVLQSDLKLSGPVTIGGALYVGDGKLTIASGDQLASVSDVTIANGTLILESGTTATLPTVAIIDSTATLQLNGAADVAINSLQVQSGAKLTIVGTADQILAGAVKLVTAGGKPYKPAAGTVFYSNGRETVELTIDETGALKSTLQPMETMNWISSTPKQTSLKGVTLDELLTYEYTGTMSGQWVNESARGMAARGYLIEKSGDSVVLYMQAQDPVDQYTKSQKIALTIGADGYVYAKGLGGGYYMTQGDYRGTVPNKTNSYVPTSDTSDGYGVKTFDATPACVNVAAIKSNYSDFAAAVAVATTKTDKSMTLLTDTTYTGARIQNPFTLTIPAGLTFKADDGANDPFHWNYANVFHVYGTLDFGRYYQSCSGTKGFGITLYGGGELTASGANALSVYEAMTIEVRPNGEQKTATISSGMQVRSAITLDVAEGMTLEMTGNFNRSVDSTSGTPQVIKTGAGTFVFVGDNNTSYPMVLNAGTFEKSLGKEETFALTVNGGTANVTSSDGDYEIEPSGETAEKTYTSTKIIWLVLVTEPGVTTWSGAGTKYKTFDAGVAAIRKLRADNPGEFVQIWAVEENMEALTKVLPEGVTINSSPSGMYLEGWDKKYYTSTATSWEANTVVISETKTGEPTATVAAGDLVTFAQGSRFPSTGNLYIRQTTSKTIEVVGNTELYVGAGTGLKPSGYTEQNFGDGWTVTIENGSKVYLAGWGSSAANRTFGTDGTVTFNGEGEAVFGTTDATTFLAKNITGSATITIPSGCTLTATGMIDNPIAGAGTLKISGDQVLKFAAGSTITVQPTTESYAYYAIESVINNPDGTTTKVYKKIELAEPNAFGKSWTNLFLGPETAGGDASWNTAANWAQINPNSIVRKTSGTPYVSGGVYTPALFDGEAMSNIPVVDGYKSVNMTDTMDGWAIMIGATNGVAVTINRLSKIQASSAAVDQSLYVDATSKITINGGTDSDKKKEHTLNLRVAAEEGVTFAEAFSDNAHFNYYLNGDGSVKWTGSITDGNHALKTADFAIGTGEFTQFKSKKLVSFTSTTKDFSFDDLVVTISDDEEATATKVASLTANSAAGSYLIRKADDGIYLDYVAKSETRPLLVWNTANKDWKAATEATIEGTSFTKVPTAEDTVVITESFTTLGSSVLYIWPNQTTKDALTACRKMIVRDGVTLHLGFAESTCNIPNDFTIKLEGSAKLVLSRWNSDSSGTCALGSNVMINGGSVEIDTTRATALTVGDLYGTTTLTIPANYTVTAQGDVGVMLTGAGTLKAANLGTIKADANWTGSVDVSAVSVGGAIGQKAPGLVVSENGDGSKTYYIREVANEVTMTAGGKLSEGTYENPLGNAITWTQIQAMTYKPTIILNKDNCIHYFGDTTGYNFIVRDASVYCMNGGPSTYAFKGSSITVESGELIFISREGLDPQKRANNWQVAPMFSAVDIDIGQNGKLKFLSDNNLGIYIKDNTKLTIKGDLRNLTIQDKFVAETTGSLDLQGSGTVELKGENKIKSVSKDRYVYLELGTGASLVTETADLKFSTKVAGKYVKATTADGKTTYALADAEGNVSFDERQNVYNFGAPAFKVSEAAAGSTVTVTIKTDAGETVTTQTGTVGDDGSVEVLVGSTDDPGKSGLTLGKEYFYEVTVGGQTTEGSFFTMNLGTWFGADASNGTDAKVGGDWATGTAPAVDTVNKVYMLTGDHTFAISEDKGANRLSYVEQTVTFTSAIDAEDLATADLGTGAFGALTIANDGNSNYWTGYIGGGWVALYGQPTTLNEPLKIRTDIHRGENSISYVINGDHLADVNGVTSWPLSTTETMPGFHAVAYKGNGILAKFEGVLPSTMVAKVGTTEYGSLEAALTAHPECGPLAAAGERPQYGVELLTSVLWAPEVGTYYITKGVYDIKVVNEKILSWNQDGTVATVAVNEAPVEGFVAPVEGGSTTPVEISGKWLNKLGTDGLTKKEIQEKLNETQEGAQMSNLEAYLLGVDADKVATTKVTTTAVQNNDPNTIKLSLAGITPRENTGVTVKVQVMAADDPSEQFTASGEAVEGASATIELPTKKVKYYRLKVKFE